MRAMARGDKNAAADLIRDANGDDEYLTLSLMVGISSSITKALAPWIGLTFEDLVEKMADNLLSEPAPPMRPRHGEDEWEWRRAWSAI